MYSSPNRSNKQNMTRATQKSLPFGKWRFREKGPENGPKAEKDQAERAGGDITIRNPPASLRGVGSDCANFNKKRIRNTEVTIFIELIRTFYLQVNIAKTKPEGEKFRVKLVKIIITFI